MTTYKMQFSAKIESINPETKQMVVEYFDPHGNESLRLAISFKYDATPEDLKQLIIDHTPDKHFHMKHIERTANRDYTELTNLVGESMEYKLPTFDNEII